MLFCVAPFITWCSQNILIKPFEPPLWKTGKVKTLSTVGPVICPMFISASGLERDFKLQHLDWNLKSYSSPGKAHIFPTFSSCSFPTEMLVRLLLCVALFVWKGSYYLRYCDTGGYCRAVFSLEIAVENSDMIPPGILLWRKKSACCSAIFPR